jgi:DNA-binding MarR family transcriptional regulator
VPENRYANAARFRAELRRFLRTSEEVSRAAGITPHQHLLLLQIGGCEEPTTVSALVEKLQLTQSAVTELVQRATQAGLVARAGSPTDGRVVLLSLTQAGEEKLAQVHDALGPERAELKRVVDMLED